MADNLAAVAAGEQITLTWDTPVGSDGVILKRDTSLISTSADGATITTLASSVTSYVENINLEGVATYYYGAVSFDVSDAFVSFSTASVEISAVNDIPGAVAGETEQQTRSRREILGHN